MVEKLNQVKKLRRELSQSLGRRPNKAELAEALELTPDKLDAILEAGRRTLSLHARVGKDEDTELLQLIEDTDELAPDARLDLNLLSDRIESLLDQLTEREREVIRLRFGLADGRSYTLSEIGALFSLSRERVRQIQAKAMRKLRHPRRQAMLEDWALPNTMR